MDLATINPWTKSVVNLTNGEFVNLGIPSWAPDSDQIVFSGMRENQETNQIFTIITDGSGLNQLTDSNHDSHSPVWAPEGDWVAYKNAGELRVITSSGEYDRSLSACDPNGGNISWSGDGRVLTYTLNSKIHMVDLYSSVYEQVTADDINQNEILPVFTADIR
jgi:Tol biopolymer transport system component